MVILLEITVSLNFKVFFSLSFSILLCLIVAGEEGRGSNKMHQRENCQDFLKSGAGGRGCF